MRDEMIIIRDIKNLQKELKEDYGSNKIIIINTDFYKQHENELKDLIEAAKLDIATAPLDKNVISITMDKHYLSDVLYRG